MKCKPSDPSADTGTASSDNHPSAHDAHDVPSYFEVPAAPSTGPGSASCCDELLLGEDQDATKHYLPSYQEYQVRFDTRMTFLGFERSPTQRQTRGDGNCGIYALLDQLNLSYHESDPIFGVEDALYARFLYLG